jgi:hypothetical protein
MRRKERNPRPFIRCSFRRDQLLLGRFNTCSIFCPPVITGGPEAIHQLSEFLNGIGIPCWITYCDRPIVRQGNTLLFPPLDTDRSRVAYGHYNPITRSEVEMRPDHLVILPEIMHHMTGGFAPAAVGVWWLSVDNARQRNPKLSDLEWRESYFRANEIIHFHHSVYAREFLRAHGVHSYALGDYTDRRFTATIPHGPGAGDSVCFNPAKGITLAQSFFTRHPDMSPLAIVRMGKAEVHAAFSHNAIYVDFGHFPGRDRMPREAAASGGVVFLHNKGSAAVYDDFPVPDSYRFDAEDVTSGRLYHRIQAVLADRQRHWGEQEMFRQEIRWERAAFGDQVWKLAGLCRDV